MSDVVSLTALVRLAHRRSVPPVPADLLAETARLFATTRPVQDKPSGEGSSDADDDAARRSRRLSRPVDERDRLSVDMACRLSALMNHLDEQGYTRKRAFAIFRGGDPKLLRAAARAPLPEPESCHADYRFDPAAFLAIVQEEGRGGRRKTGNAWPPAVQPATTDGEASDWIAEVDPANLLPLHRALLQPRRDDPPTLPKDALRLVRNRVEPFEMVNICCRLMALYCLMSDEDLGPWLIRREHGITYVRDPGAFVRAAARAPLRRAREVMEDRFDPKPFLAIVLEEATTAGRT
jgi:hypothetical protein